MNANLTEQRRHIRVYFNSAEETLCQLACEEKAVASLSAMVRDLGMGGLRVSIKGGIVFAVGDQLVLNGLTHRSGFCCHQQLPLEVRWLTASAQTGSFDMGCQFLSLAEESRADINSLIRMKISEYQNSGSLPILST